MFFSFDSKKKKLLSRIGSDPGMVFSIREAFRDEALGEAVAKALGLGSVKAKTNLSQLSNIKNLDASGLGIESLEGLEFLNGLETANFSGNNIRQLPDYTKTNPSLYKNKDTLIFMNLTENPFLDPNRLFSLDASENRRKFLSQFQDVTNRISLGEAEGKIFVDQYPNPTLVRIAIENFLPRRPGVDREEQINDILLRYIVGKKLFYNQNAFGGKYLFNDGKVAFRTEDINPAYLRGERADVASEIIELMLSPEDLYLLRSLANSARKAEPRTFGGVDEALAYFKAQPEELSADYIKTDKGFIEKEDYSVLKASGVSSEDERRLNAIADEGVKNDYARYLDFRAVLDQYRKDHPDRDVNVARILRKSDDFINNFLQQYLALQDNVMLSESQRETLSTAGPSLRKFVDNFADQARSFFDQDLFGLEVEMKYIDMLEEAEKKFGQ